MYGFFVSNVKALQSSFSEIQKMISFLFFFSIYVVSMKDGVVAFLSCSNLEWMDAFWLEERECVSNRFVVVAMVIFSPSFPHRNSNYQDGDRIPLPSPTTHHPPPTHPIAWGFNQCPIPLPLPPYGLVPTAAFHKRPTPSASCCPHPMAAAVPATTAPPIISSGICGGVFAPWASSFCPALPQFTTTRSPLLVLFDASCGRRGGGGEKQFDVGGGDLHYVGMNLEKRKK